MSSNPHDADASNTSAVFFSISLGISQTGHTSIPEEVSGKQHFECLLRHRELVMRTVCKGKHVGSIAPGLHFDELARHIVSCNYVTYLVFLDSPVVSLLF